MRSFSNVLFSFSLITIFYTFFRIRSESCQLLVLILVVTPVLLDKLVVWALAKAVAVLILSLMTTPKEELRTHTFAFLFLVNL